MELKIVIVHSRAARFCLGFEWAALPIGCGAATAIPFNIVRAVDGGPAWWASALLVVAPLIFIVIGIRRPMHRRLGLQRNSLWCAP